MIDYFPVQILFSVYVVEYGVYAKRKIPLIVTSFTSVDDGYIDASKEIHW